MDPTSSTSRAPQNHSGSRWLLVAVFFALALASVATTLVIRQQGVDITGDEPNYLVVADAIGHDHSLMVGVAYERAYAHQYIFPRSVFGTHPGSRQDAAQETRGRDGLMSTHGLGLPILLAAPLEAGGVPFAQLTLVLVLSALSVWLAAVTGRVSGVRSPWRVAVVGLLLSPVYLLASTQVDPDLLSGLLVALTIMLLAETEQSRRATKVRFAAVGVILGYLPWVHPKNILIALVLAVALVVVSRRTRLRPALLAYAAVPAAGGWLLLGAYNVYASGHLSGPYGHDVVSFGLDTWTTVVAMLTDRQQGLVVQLPIVLLGVAGIWLLRGRIPVAVGAAVVVLVLVMTLNASCTVCFFGGRSFAGRYLWETFPVLVAFGGLYLLRLTEARPRPARIVIAIVAGLYAVQALPILAGAHVFYNAIHVPNASWDPSVYPGWWGPLDGLFPSFLGLGAAWQNQRVWLGVVFVAALASVALGVLIALASPRPDRRTMTGVIALVALTGVAVAAAAGAASSTQLPGPRRLDASTLPSHIGHVEGTARVVRGSTQHGALVYGPYLKIGAGRYRATIRYRLVDIHPKAVQADVVLDLGQPDVVLFDRPGSPRPIGPLTLTTHWLGPSSATTSAELAFTAPDQGTLEVRVSWFGTGELRVDWVKLTKLSNT